MNADSVQNQDIESTESFWAVYSEPLFEDISIWAID